MTEKLTRIEKASLLSGKNVWQTRGVPRRGIPSVFMADGPHGVRKQMGSSDHLGLNQSEPSTCFPTAATLANSWDDALAEELGAALGAEAANLDVDVLLGPGLNIKRSPLCGRNFEYFSEDPFLSGKLAAALVRGIQSRGVAATPKHFAVNSQELRRMTTDSVLDERTLREIYLTGFEIVVREAAPRAIMSSYNLVNGTYANEDPFLLTTVLREEWGFNGAVITDWGGGNDAVRGAVSGSSIEMPSPGLDSVRQLVAAVARGDLTEDVLDERVNEVLDLARGSRTEASAPVDLDVHHALARRAAAASVVLLKNDEQILPLAPGTRVGVIGDFAAHPRYQGSGSSVVNPTILTTALDAISESELVLVDYAQGFDRHGRPDPVLEEAAVLVASSSDVVLAYLGLDEISESEGLDRTHLRLPDNQLQLLAKMHAVNRRVVVVLSAGSVTEMPWLDQCSALLHGYLGGQAGAAAMMDVVTGVVNPSGKLAETFPLRHEDSPAFAYFPGEERTAEYREGLYVGYRYYTTSQKRVQFPFGFGLSYTSFEYSAIVVSSAGARFVVSNTGSLAGDEIAQLYIGRTGEGVHRPARELKGYVKVSLSPGESITVSIPFDDKSFRYFDTERRSWLVETATYSVMIGASVDDIRLEGSIFVEGSTPPGTTPEELSRYASADVTTISDLEFTALLGRNIPESRWGSGPLGINDPLCRMRDARNPLARLAFRALSRRKVAAEADYKPDLNVLFLYNMPFRSIAKMTNGAVSMEMVQALVTLVNSRFLGGLGSFIMGAARNALRNRRTLRALGGVQ